MRSKTKGFTLFELIVTIAVAAIIVTVGVPGFQNIIANNRAVTHTNDLVTALNLARSEATRRGIDVLVCRSTDGATCEPGLDWSSGWVVRTAGVPGTLLRSWPKRSGGNGIITADVTSPTRFRARGSLGSGASEFDVQLPDCTGNQIREVTIKAAGRIAVERSKCP